MKLTFKNYLAYLKDNPDNYWFRRKLYGWGWTPATWQGWLVLVFFIALIIYNFISIDQNSHSVSDTLRPFFIRLIIMLILLIGICWKTGEPPKWQWGMPEKK